MLFQRRDKRDSNGNLLATLGAFEARYVPIVWAPTPEEAGQLIERYAYWFAREILLAANSLAKLHADS